MTFIIKGIGYGVSSIISYLRTPSEKEILKQKYLKDDHYRQQVIDNLVKQFFVFCDATFNYSYKPQTYFIKFILTQSWEKVEKMLNEDGNVQDHEVREWCSKWRDKIATMKSYKNSIDAYRTKLNELQAEPQVIQIPSHKLSRLLTSIEGMNSNLTNLLNEAYEELNRDLKNPKLLECSVSKNVLNFLKDNWKGLSLFSMKSDVSMNESLLVPIFEKCTNNDITSSLIVEETAIEGTAKGIFKLKDGELATWPLNSEMAGTQPPGTNLMRPRSIDLIQYEHSKSPHPRKRLDNFEDNENSQELGPTACAMPMYDIVVTVQKIVNDRLKDANGINIFLDLDDSAPREDLRAIAVLKDVKSFLFS